MGQNGVESRAQRKGRLLCDPVPLPRCKSVLGPRAGVCRACASVGASLSVCLGAAVSVGLGSERQPGGRAVLQLLLTQASALFPQPQGLPLKDSQLLGPGSGQTLGYQVSALQSP